MSGLLIEKVISEAPNLLKNEVWTLIYKFDEVILKKYDGNSEELSNITLDDIKEARIFNKQDELKIWRYQGDIKFRLFSAAKKDDYEEPYQEEMLLNEIFISAGNKPLSIVAAGGRV